MIHFKNFVCLLCVSAFLFLLPSASLAESRIYLNDGRVLKVDSFWREEGMVKYESFGGIVGIPLDEVDRIITPDMLAFEEAKKLDTVEAYKAFIKQHPKSDYTVQSKERIRALEFEDVKRINSAKVYLDYISRSPNSLYLEEAKDRAEVLIFQDAVRSQQVKKYKGYLEIYPEGRYHQTIQKALEFANIEALKKGNSIPDIEAFLKANPESAFRQELEESLAGLVSQSEERARTELEKQKQAKSRMALEASKKRKRWIFIASIMGILIAAVLVTLLLLRKRWSAASVPGSARTEEMEPNEMEPNAMEPNEMEPNAKIEAARYTSDGSVRYEDLIGVPRKDDTPSLPGQEGIRALDHDRPMSLPNPEDLSKQAEEDEDLEETGESVFQNARSSDAKDSDSIILGYDGQKGPPSHADGSESEVDLSDHETDFKLELEDAPKESEEAGINEASLEDELDHDKSDLPDMFDDEEIKRRRGGGSKG
jgi:hypothetical protein